MLTRKQPEDGKLPGGVEVAIGELLDPGSVEQAMQSVDKLYLLNTVAPDELTKGLIAYDLAKRLKLKHIAYHSVFGVERFKDVPHFASKLAIENAIREFDVPFTIIRPNYFSQNDARLKDAPTKAGVYPMPLGHAGIAVVDIRDIAEATAIALTSDGHFGKTSCGDRMLTRTEPAFSSVPRMHPYRARPRRPRPLTEILGHAPRRYEDFAKETAIDWQKQ